MNIFLIVFCLISFFISRISASFKIHDIVILNGLSNESYNGIHGMVIKVPSNEGERYSVLLYLPSSPYDVKVSSLKVENLFEPIYSSIDDEPSVEECLELESIVKSMNELVHLSSGFSFEKKMHSGYIIRIIGSYIHTKYGYKGCLKALEIIGPTTRGPLLMTWNGIGELNYFN